ncbi:MAG: hypothetical protein ACOX6U_10685 [Oscillospiraceae bacterium]|jgi:hypothetical protein
MTFTVPDARNKKRRSRMIGTKAQAHFPPAWFPAFFSANGAVQAEFYPHKQLRVQPICGILSINSCNSN